MTTADDAVNQFMADRERLLRENARLREEVASLQTENAQLRERIEVISVKFKCSWCGENLADHSCEDAARAAALTKRCEAALEVLDEARASTFNDLGQAESYEAGAVHAAMEILRSAALESNDGGST